LPDSPIIDSQSRSTFIKKLDYDPNDPASIKQEVKSVIKYLSKPSSIPTAEAFAEFFLATKGRQLVRSYGVVRSISSANHHYLDKGVNNSAIIGEGASPRAKREGRTGDDEIILAAQERLMKMRAAKQEADIALEGARRVDAMPSWIECINCKAVISPELSVCEQCRSEEIAQAEQRRNMA
jgi:hypothetical protein